MYKKKKIKFFILNRGYNKREVTFSNWILYNNKNDKIILTIENNTLIK